MRRSSGICSCHRSRGELRSTSVMSMRLLDLDAVHARPRLNSVVALMLG